MITDTKELIKSLKHVREERGLNIDQIYEIVYESDPKNAPSRSSIARVFADGSENDASHFRFENTLKPICNALLDIENNEKDDSPDDMAFKSLLRYKKDLIEQYAEQLKEAKEELKTIKEKERKKYEERIDKETKQFHDSLAFAMEQIKLKDARIADLTSVNREQSETNKEHALTIKEIVATNSSLVETNNKLVVNLMNCPLKHQEE